MKKINKLLFGISLLSVVISGCSPKGDTPSKKAPTDDYPNFSEDGTSVTYGYYPQTVVNKASTISALNKISSPTLNGWYQYNGNYYAKFNAKPYSSTSATFDNGEVIEVGKQYWFKCEPINWKVLSYSSGKHFVASEKLLDPCAYYHSTENRTIGGKTIYPSNYEHSDVRTWLNEDFYNSAFRLNSSYVQTTLVDNSASTTDSNKNPYICNNTSDKIFLLSYKEFINAEYGFDHDVGRKSKTTDWARARGAAFDLVSLTYKLHGHQWTRSPSSQNVDLVYHIDVSGSYGVRNIINDYYCPRPAMNIKVA